jgi:hypothetical protein
MGDAPPPDDRHVMLTATGYVYHAAARRWVHREHGRVISHETVAVHDTDWLAHWITETP